jgi:thioredoxin 1
VDDIGAEFGDRVKVVKVEVGKAPNAAAKYGVSAIPNVIIFDRGQIRAQLLGLRPKQALVNALLPIVGDAA